MIGVALAALASFLLYTPLTNTFDSIVEPVVKFPFQRHRISRRFLAVAVVSCTCVPPCRP